MTAEENCLLALCRAGFLRQTMPAWTEPVDWMRVLALAQAHKVSALVAETALAYCALAPDARTEAKRLVDTARYTEAVQCYEVTRLLARFEEAGVDCCALKGWHWRLLYPKPYQRDMGDVDLLMRLEQWKDACRIAQELGFEKGLDIDLHASLYKHDVKLELHRTLLSSHGMHEERYRDIWARLIPGATPHEWRVPPTDEYLYFFLHSEKHVASYVFTLRTLTDIAALRAQAQALDRDRFAREARQMGLSGYIANLEALSEAWLGGGTLTPAQTRMLSYLMELMHLTETEKRYRTARRWLAINLTPAAVLRNLFAPRALLLARYDDATPVQAMERGLRRTLRSYRVCLRDYRKGRRGLPRERRRWLNRGQRMLYKRARR